VRVSYVVFAINLACLTWNVGYAVHHPPPGVVNIIGAVAAVLVLRGTFPVVCARLRGD